MLDYKQKEINEHLIPKKKNIVIIKLKKMELIIISNDECY